MPHELTARGKQEWWGQLIRLARADRGWTAKNLAARANLSEQTVLAAESGSRGTSAGSMMEFTDPVGVPLSGIENRAKLAIRRSRGEELLSLMPSRVYRFKEHLGGDNFSADGMRLLARRARAPLGYCHSLWAGLTSKG